MLLSTSFWLRRAVQRSVAARGEQDITAPASKRDEGLIVALSLADLAIVVRPRDGISRRCEGRQEEGAFQLSVSLSGGGALRIEAPERHVTGASLAYTRQVSG